MKEKRCKTCLDIKSVDDFWKRKDAKDGLRSSCTECLSGYNKTYASEHSEEAVLRATKHVSNNKDKVASYQKKYKEKNFDKISNYQKDYKITHRIERSEKEKILRRDDVQFKLSTYLRSRLVKAIKENHKSGSAVRDLGCTILELKSHLEKQFKPGMTWDNWSRYGWHIDHIKPLASFDLSNPEQFRQAVCYTNLQPLWWIENLKKNRYGEKNGQSTR